MTACGARHGEAKLGRAEVMGAVTRPALAAHRIAERLDIPTNARRGLLVFVNDAHVYAVKPDSVLAVRQRASDLVGCYRRGASAGWIEADLMAWSADCG